MLVKVNLSLQIKSYSVLNDQGWVVIIHELKLLRKETGPEKTIKIAVNMVVVDFLYTCLINLLIDLWSFACQLKDLFHTTLGGILS